MTIDQDFSGERLMCYCDEDDNETWLIVTWEDNEVQYAETNEWHPKPYRLTREQREYFQGCLSYEWVREDN